MKNYMDIERLKTSFVDGFEVGDLIYIQEKIDGANFSIKYNEETDIIKAFSRKRELDYKETLRGAWNYAQSLDKDLLKNTLGNNLILFGEWLVKHTVEYPKDKYQQAYFYDIYDEDTKQYLPQNEVSDIIKKLGVNSVPVFYVGKFESWDLINEYVGKTDMGGEYGEGIVIKNMTKLNNPNTRLPFYTKIVCGEFCETKAHRGSSKTTDFGLLEERNRVKELVETIVTMARIKKLLNKFIDEGLLVEDWDSKDMKTIAQNLGRRVYDDCIKEESETVEQVGELFGKFASSIAMGYVKELLNSR